MTKHTLHDAPPPRGRGPGRPRKFFPEDLLEELRAQPGAWAIGGTAKNSGQAVYWRKRLEPEGFHIITRKNDDDMVDFWVTYERSN